MTPSPPPNPDASANANANARSTVDPSTVPATADLVDQHGDALASSDLQLRQYGGLAAFTGTVRTVRCFQDNALVKQVLAGPGDGQVLVVDGGGSLHSALMGDLIAASAVAHGWAGVVIHGAVRDVTALGDLPLGVKALGSNPRKSAKDGAGEVDVPVSFGGVTYRPGQRLWSDDDGIVVLDESSVA
jgi:regulator of ribonuclease activity A